MKDLSPLYIFRAQWRATFKFQGHEEKASRKHNWSSVVLIFVIPILVSGITVVIYFLPSLFRKTRVASITLMDIGNPLLASLAILAGALITAFSLLASWRSLVSKQVQKGRDYSPERWLLDTSCAHLLSGAYTSIIASFVIVLGNILEVFNNNICKLIGDSLALGLSTHVAMSLVIALPGLYSAYTQLNDVDPILNGHDDL